MVDAQGAVISHNQERPREEAGQNQDILPQIWYDPWEKKWVISSGILITSLG